jgi:hypothetical protein
MYIWNSLTKEEKFILYDLAEDGLVNTHGHIELTMPHRQRSLYNGTMMEPYAFSIKASGILLLAPLLYQNQIN